MTQPANLIIFLADNHNRQFMSAAGHSVVKTPNLDSIADRGVRFTSAYCGSPLCCPSRAAIATGRYPHQTGYWDNVLAYDGQVPSWHHRIRDAGHEMTAIGKLHFRSEKDDNGFTEEIDTMHIIGGKGALIHLLRSTDSGVPRRKSHKAVYADSGIGEADYQIYDRRITDYAINWLKTRGKQEKPWVLVVSYPSPHPPFRVPKRFWDMYPPEKMVMPPQWHTSDQPTHPAAKYLAWMNRMQGGPDEEYIRRAIAGYCGLITHMDEQVGQVIKTVEEMGLLDKTRLLYTSDHGEAAGHHGIMGRNNLYEHSIGVPLLMAGPGIPEGKVSNQLVSHVDLYPTIIESVGLALDESEKDLPGISLWPAINGSETDQAIFVEFSALGSRKSGCVLREGQYKFIYHVGMPNQLFDLDADPNEERDILADNQNHPIATDLESKLRTFVYPEKVEAQSKKDQAAHMEKHGGPEAVLKTGYIHRSPIPGKDAETEFV